jgi:hypothetical protein
MYGLLEVQVIAFGLLWLLNDADTIVPLCVNMIYRILVHLTALTFKMCIL